MKLFNSLLFVVLLFSTSAAFAQEEETVNPIDTLTQFSQKLDSRISKLENLKITGYLQFQYQKADSMGINSMAGGNFSKFSDSRFMTRRGRIKFA
ncbi:MAG: hypothetical protein Q8859_12920, partial [Bacteroidota bacterium]|nr:hypothetical protein [Bacteroidota bacterium]